MDKLTRDAIIGSLVVLFLLAVFVWLIVLERRAMKEMAIVEALDEAQRWREECYLLQRENAVLSLLEQKLIPRIVDKWGDDFQQFLIERYGNTHLNQSIEEKPVKKFIIDGKTYINDVLVDDDEDDENFQSFQSYEDNNHENFDEPEPYAPMQAIEKRNRVIDFFPISNIIAAAKSRKKGRSKKYASNAERQRAYRNRQRA